MNLHFEELTGSGGARIGIASLDAPKSLNALSLSMILALQARRSPQSAAAWILFIIALPYVAVPLFPLDSPYVKKVLH